MLREERGEPWSALPPLNCFSRSGRPIAGWNAGGSTAARPSSKPVAPPAAARRQHTPPVERPYLRGGARENTTPVLGRDAASGRAHIRPSGAGGSRGTLGTTSAHMSPARPRNRTPLQPVVAPSLAPVCGAAPAAVTPPASSAVPATGSSEKSSSTKCDKCDGPHPTNNCPWFKKPRDKHPDAKPASEKKLLGLASGPVEVLRHGSVRVTRQPGDGSCLFHSMSHGLRDGSTATGLRRQVAEFISENPSLMISDSPLKDWVLWDSGQTVSTYSRRIGQGGVWGGGIEMAAVSHMKGVNVYVYQQSGGAFKRISSFEGASPGGKARVVRVLYGGGVHYDALDLTADGSARR